MNSAALLHLLHLASPALPVGAYAYSQGQEYAVELGHLRGMADAKNWIGGVMCHSVARLDLPVLSRVYAAWQSKDVDQVNYWNQFLQASRESAEFELEDVQMGRALMRLLTSLDVPEAIAWSPKKPVCFVTVFALAGVYWKVDLPALRHGFCWSWLENQVAAATKLIPLGQTDAQKLLLSLMESVKQCCIASQDIADNDIGAGLPALALISAQHETQYSRLFRS
jgi:urease accessory protein